MRQQCRSSIGDTKNREHWKYEGLLLFVWCGSSMAALWTFVTAPCSSSCHCRAERSCFLCRQFSPLLLLLCPGRLAFTLWGCCGLCLWCIPAELAHAFWFCLCVYFCLYGPFNCVSFHKFSRQLSVFSLCSSYFCLIGLFNYMFLLKVSFSPDIISGGWLGSKHQLIY